MQSGPGLALLEERLTAKNATPDTVGFDPTIIIAIISAIIPLIQNCFQRSPQALRRRLLNRSRLAAAIRRETGVAWPVAFSQADDLFDLAGAATDSELQLLIDDCCRK